MSSISPSTWPQIDAALMPFFSSETNAPEIFTPVRTLSGKKIKPCNNAVRGEVSAFLTSAAGPSFAPFASALLSPQSSIMMLYGSPLEFVLADDPIKTSHQLMPYAASARNTLIALDSVLRLRADPWVDLERLARVERIESVIKQPILWSETLWIAACRKQSSTQIEELASAK